ncbi:rap1 GTPase-activating protein 1-like isoform X3 [Rhopilema esculentum]|uniref:rap1 GTPase-activating protein 1-like isoform X3 n=1 Tax=Rhopilema esculentum TaxID=499914 RepID=UPI0031CF6761
MASQKNHLEPIVAPNSDAGSKAEDRYVEELDFLEMLGRLQSSRLDDQRTSLPASLAKQDIVEESTVEMPVVTEDSSTEEDDSLEPIQQVLALGSPYPLVVLPVEGDYWMEGTNHILQRDKQNRPVMPRVDLSKCVVDSDHTATVYRNNFLGKEHLNYAALDHRFGPLLLSVKSEVPGEYSDESKLTDHYEIILRLNCRTIHQFVAASSMSENPRPREIIQNILQDELDIDRFHPIAIPRITEHIVKYDEHILTNCYKIGVIYQKHKQTTEEEYFGNKTHSPAMEEFLDCLGTKVQLQGFQGYRGGLDVRHNQTGETSYHTVFKEREFMFHVSTLLPFKPEDRQQVQRKRHIGNDIVAIVFQDENTPFSPTSVRSHFLHVFIIVQVIDANTPNCRYKVTVTARDGVPRFSPALPNPAVFRKGREFREFLMTKILNAELAACKSEKFSQLAERTRAMLLQQLVNDLIMRNEQCMEEGLLTRTNSGGKGKLLSSFKSALANSKGRNGSSVSLASNTSLQTPKNGISLSLNDITDVSADDAKKEKKKLFSRGRSSKDNGQEQTRKESNNSLASPSSPNNGTWPSTNLASVNEGRDFFGFRSKSVETPPSGKTLHYMYEGPNSACSSPSVTYNRRKFLTQPEMSSTNRSSINGVYQRNARSSSFNDSESLRNTDPQGVHSKYISVSSCSSYEDISSSSACSALDAAQREIDVLRSEISKLKTDKMDLVRQNVTYQREIRKYKEKSLHQTAELYAAKHELAKLRFVPKHEEDVNHNNESPSRQSDYFDNEMTPVNHKDKVIFFGEDSPHTKRRSMTVRNEPLKATVSDALSSVHHHQKRQQIVPNNKRHSISHV